MIYNETDIRNLGGPARREVHWHQRRTSYL